MATDLLALGNEALIRIGVETITALTDTSKQARILTKIGQDCVDAVLEAYDWYAARQQASLTKDSTSPTHTWDYRYLLPPGGATPPGGSAPDPYCLRLLKVLDTEGIPVTYELQGRYILCDEEDGLDITYVKRISDYTTLSPELSMTIVARLAQLMLPSFTYTASRKASIDTDYRESILKAKMNGACQDYADNKQDGEQFKGESDWLLAGR